MKITINFDDNDLKEALQYHLDYAMPIQSYIKHALRFFDTARRVEMKGLAIGVGDKDRMSQYNRVISCFEDNE